MTLADASWKFIFGPSIQLFADIHGLSAFMLRKIIVFPPFVSVGGNLRSEKKKKKKGKGFEKELSIAIAIMVEKGVCVFFKYNKSSIVFFIKNNFLMYI